MGIQGNEIADEETKDDLLAIEKFPPQDLINWIKTENKKNKMAK
jgi:hypothetical protein